MVNNLTRLVLLNLQYW